MTLPFENDTNAVVKKLAKQNNFNDNRFLKFKWTENSKTNSIINNETTYQY